jgi:hypothetical protein
MPADSTEQRRLLEAFIAAAQDGDVAGLQGVLASNVVSTPDGSGLTRWTRPDRRTVPVDRPAALCQWVAASARGPPRRSFTPPAENSQAADHAPQIDVAPSRLCLGPTSPKPLQSASRVLVVALFSWQRLEVVALAIHHGDRWTAPGSWEGELIESGDGGVLIVARRS